MQGLEPAEHSLVAEEETTFRDRQFFHIDRPVDALRRVILPQLQVVFRTGPAAAMQDVVLGIAVHMLQDVQVAGPHDLFIFFQINFLEIF